jgi:hypothetical protein
MNEEKKSIFEMNELVDEQLEEIAKTKVVIPEEDNTINDAHKFILHFNVKEGVVRVPSFMIYQAYKNWISKLGLSPQHKNMFLRDFAKMGFKSKKDPYFRYYLLDPTPFNLTEEAYKLHRDEQNIETAKRKKEKATSDKYKEIVQRQEKKENETK